ncbi:hypothetical protein LCGC14_2893710 [marine sediment metagenome]|uniref:Uncharacterized protein n=1 Tax=marine sediment metagenome TaxID=412755 RepID=A0A0F8YI97_9ZZZZ
MALKVSEAAILLRRQLQEALRACAPERGITDWLDEIADDIGYPRSSLRALYYGQAVNTPKGGALYALLAHKKLGRRFLNYLLLQPLFPCAPANVPDISDEIATLRATADSLEATQTSVVPIPRRRA